MSREAKKSKTRKKKKKSFDLKNWLSQKLRRISYQFPPRKDAIKKGRVARGKYRCSSCLGENFGPKDIQLDHRIPVIDPHEGWQDWNTYIERLFCEESNFNILCKSCHELKTFRENEIRKQVKREKIQTKEEDDNDI